MKVVVDLNLCQGHGECTRNAAGLFKLGQDLELEWEAYPDERRQADVEAAAAACPTQSISISYEE